MKAGVPPNFYLRAQKKFGGRYIARRRDRILAAAKTLKDLLKIMKVRKIKHEGDVSIGYVPAYNSTHVYTFN